MATNMLPNLAVDLVRLASGRQRKVMFRYLVMTMRTPQFQASVIEAHQAFLEDIRQRGNLEMSGPFTDKTGGAYLIRAENIEGKSIGFY